MGHNGVYFLVMEGLLNLLDRQVNPVDVVERIHAFTAHHDTEEQLVGGILVGHGNITAHELVQPGNAAATPDQQAAAARLHAHDQTCRQASMQALQPGQGRGQSIGGFLLHQSFQCILPIMNIGQGVHVQIVLGKKTLLLSSREHGRHRCFGPCDFELAVHTIGLLAGRTGAGVVRKHDHATHGGATSGPPQQGTAGDGGGGRCAHASYLHCVGRGVPVMWGENEKIPITVSGRKRGVFRVARVLSDACGQDDG